jgi:hypothetical protein
VEVECYEKSCCLYKCLVVGLVCFFYSELLQNVIFVAGKDVRRGEILMLIA